MSIEMPSDESALLTRERLRRLQDIQDDDPITLSEASEIVLRGAVSVATLRAEIRRGNLAVERIGKNLFTTRAYIKQMRARWLVPAGSQDGGIEPCVTEADELAALKAATRNLLKKRCSNGGK